MGSSPGDFGSSGKHLYCTAKSKRSGVQCKGIAVVGSRTQKCRMHGGTAPVGGDAPGFKHGRHSKYLPADMERLYGEAISNPDLLELAEHVGLLEARIQHILRQWTDSGAAVPQWGEVKEWFDDLLTTYYKGDTDAMAEKFEAINARLEAGQKWDTAWAQIQETMEQLRKMADTEIKRKKELNQMVPIERVVAFMGAVGMAVKRNVKNPAEIEAVSRELAMLFATNTVVGSNDPRMLRVGSSPEPINDAEIIDIPALTQ